MTSSQTLSPTIWSSETVGPGSVNGNGDEVGRRICEAMLKVVGAHGYQECSVEQVIEAAPSSRGAFYRRFDNKLHCFLAAYDLGVDRLASRLVEAGGAGPWASRVRRVLVETARFVEEEPAVSRALLLEVHAAGPDARGRRVAVSRQAAQTLEATAGEGAAGSPRRHEEFVALGIIGAIEMALQSRLERGSVGELWDVIPDLVQFALAPYIGAKSAAQERRWAVRDCALRSESRDAAQAALTGV